MNQNEAPVKVRTGELLKALKSLSPETDKQAAPHMYFKEIAGVWFANDALLAYGPDGAPQSATAPADFGAITGPIAYRALVGYLSACDELSTSVITQDDDRVTIRDAGGHANFNVLPACEPPARPEPGQLLAELPEFMKLYKWLSKASARDDTRPALQHIAVSRRSGNATLTTADGYRLHRYHHSSPGPDFDTIMLPARSRLPFKPSDTVELYYNEATHIITLKGGGKVAVVQAGTMDAPDYDFVIGAFREVTTRFTLDVNELWSVLKRLKSHSDVVRLGVKGRTVELSAGGATVLMDIAPCQGPPQAAAFTAQFLRDFVPASRAERATSWQVSLVSDPRGIPALAGTNEQGRQVLLFSRIGGDTKQDVS